MQLDKEMKPETNDSRELEVQKHSTLFSLQLILSAAVLVTAITIIDFYLFPMMSSDAPK